LLQEIEKILNENNILDICYDNIKLYERIHKQCLDITNEKVLIIGDSGFTNRFISPILSYTNYLACQKQGIDSELVIQSPKHRLMDADEKTISALQNLKEENVVIANISERMGSLQPIGKSFRKYCTSQSHKFISCTSLASVTTNEIEKFISPLDINYKALQKKHIKLKKKLDNGSEIHITTKAGTDVLMNIQDRVSICADGIYTQKGRGGNLPSGEVYIPPVEDKIDGKVVIDVSTKTTKETILNEDPVELHIKKGSVYKIIGKREADELKIGIDWAMEHAKNKEGLKQIGELGIGLNKKARPIGCTVIDEKAYGTAHIAIGSNYWFGGKAKSLIHLDQVFNKPKFKIDGRKINP
jgi:leucyl aminopeptidase (aminopeptidase T)